MLNKKLLATVLVGCLGCATAQADDVTIYFEANVIGSACVLKVAADGAVAHETTTVDFGDVKDNVDATNLKQVNFTLTNCGAGVQSATVKPGQASGRISGHKIVSGESSSATGSANIAFYADSSAQTPFLLEAPSGGGTAGSIQFNSSELTQSKSIYVRLEKADTPVIGPVNDHIIFSAVYQ